MGPIQVKPNAEAQQRLQIGKDSIDAIQVRMDVRQSEQYRPDQQAPIFNFSREVLLSATADSTFKMQPSLVPQTVWDLKNMLAIDYGLIRIGQETITPVLSDFPKILGTWPKIHIPSAEAFAAAKLRAGVAMDRFDEAVQDILSPKIENLMTAETFCRAMLSSERTDSAVAELQRREIRDSFAGIDELELSRRLDDATEKKNLRVFEALAADPLERFKHVNAKMHRCQSDIITDMGCMWLLVDLEDERHWLDLAIKRVAAVRYAIGVSFRECDVPFKLEMLPGPGCDAAIRALKQSREFLTEPHWEA